MCGPSRVYGHPHSCSDVSDALASASSAQAQTTVLRSIAGPPGFHTSRVVWPVSRTLRDSLGLYNGVVYTGCNGIGCLDLMDEVATINRVCCEGFKSVGCKAGSGRYVLVLIRSCHCVALWIMQYTLKASVAKL